MRKLTGEKLEAELARLEGMRAYEHQYESAGIVCGIDEAGRGPLAGPVVAARSAVLPKDCTILRLNDSKKLSGKNAGKNYFWKSKKRQLPTELEL
ncbi:MAG: hypothetical protein ACLR8P_08680 [Clostridium fessum]